ncbi:MULTISPECIES: tetratricopeptide repeat protein [unclassified Microcoleus]|uniref:tetratricopeptide repeat protein n=1 Tax=unclassified Microcoleus TaxID=2642155 RepID=UPI002FD523E5
MKNNYPSKLRQINLKDKTFIYFAIFGLTPLIPIVTASRVDPIINGLHPQVSGIDRPEMLAIDCDDYTADPRGPLDVLIPYIISPRRTLLLNERPKLRWNKVPGVNNYTVSLVKGERTIWETKVNGNEVVYPGTLQLEPGFEYLLVVKAENGRTSDEEKLPARSFRMLPTTEKQLVKGAIEQIDSQKIAETTKALQRAYFYIGSDLKSEAIETLEALVARGFQEAIAYRKLGDLYWQEGVTLLAESNYLQAHKLASAAKDIGEQAQLEEALGELYGAIGEKQEAVRWLMRATNSHKALGNTPRVKEIETQIAKLKASVAKPQRFAGGLGS